MSDKARELANAIKRLRILEERARQTGPGGLMFFVRSMWPVLEPGREFVDGWPIHAIAEHLEAVERGEINRLLVTVPPGFMKACSHDTSVLTTAGWKKHGQLAVGDFVYGPDGLPKLVTGRTPNVLERCYEVTFDDGASVAVGEGHLWQVERKALIKGEKKPHDKKNGFYWKHCRQTQVVPTVDLRGKERRLTSHRPDAIRLTQPIAGEQKELPIDPYLLGVWLGDGFSAQGQICCGTQDFEHFVQLGRPYKPRCGVYIIQIDGLRVKLRDSGLLGNKHIPAAYLESSSEQRWALLQGLMDTDGSVSPEGWCSFVNGNLRLFEGVIALMCSLGLKAVVGAPHFSNNTLFKKRGPYHRVRFTPPPGSKIFLLKRKQDKISTKKQKKSTEHRYVKGIKDAGERFVNCIEVDGSLYLVTEKFITTHNSLMINVMFPCWVWGPQNKPHTRGLSFSYAAHLTERDNEKCRTLIQSKQYQELWGDRFKLASDSKIKISNDHQGWLLASSVGGISTGERADILRTDDPHNAIQGESERVRNETVRWFKESMSNRLNDMKKSSIIVVHQRLHEEDVAGSILSEPDAMGYEHLNIPMEYETEPAFKAYSSIGWKDPRTYDGELAWPERFPQDECDKLKSILGPFGWSSQYSQNPEPRGGGIIKRNWWRLWEGKDNKFPATNYIIASLDPAYTEKQENDPSAMTVYGLFRHPETNEPGIMLMYAWRKRLALHGDTSPKFPGESHKAYERRCGDSWGLVEWVANTCDMYNADCLLIESKASGISVFQEIERRQTFKAWATELVDTGRLDKVARAYSVQGIFSQGLVWAPDRDFATMVIDEASAFPKARHEDLVDCTTMTLRRLREMGLLQFQDEREYEEYVEQNRSPATQPLYPV